MQPRSGGNVEEINMKYIIMCGGSYEHWKQPKQLTKIHDEPIVARTIRLLRECGIHDIAISSNNELFEKFNVPVLKHENTFSFNANTNKVNGYWCDAFYPTDEPVCYVFGDVVFSLEAIKTIVDTQTDDIQFFASAPPFAHNYPKKYAEPFALKVVNTDHLKQAIKYIKENYDKFYRTPIMWELWQVIKNTPINKIDYTNYVAINDYTCDLDFPSDVEIFENIISDKKYVTKYMIHAVPKRMWYVTEFLIPSMIDQGIDRKNISVYVDENKLGNLRACMEAFKSVDNDKHGTWHLQDDVVISSNFKKVTERFDEGIVCGFFSRYDGTRADGLVGTKEMWFSFPCIRIPNQIAIGCANWTLRYLINNPVYKEFVGTGVNDDWAFRSYIDSYYKNMKVTNLNPNIVDHIDYLIGGTSKGVERDVEARSRLWKDHKVIRELEKKLKERNALHG